MTEEDRRSPGEPRRRAPWWAAFRRRTTRALLVAGLLTLAPLPPLESLAAVDPDLPRLAIEAPPELATAANRIRALDPRRLASVLRITGLESPGEPIRVILAPEGSDAARSAPPWVSGWAYGSLGTVVLLPERTPSYPDSSLEELLRHEIAHVLIARAAGGREVPRWFNEGLAMAAAEVWSLEDRSRVTLASLAGGAPPLAELDRLFAGDRGDVARAYALSGAFVQDMLRAYGSAAPAGVLSRLAIGQPFEEAFVRSTGWTLERAEEAFRRRWSIWYRWVPVFSSSLTLWLAITLLALWAGRRRRARAAALEAQWEEEERRLYGPPPDETVN